MITNTRMIPERATNGDIVHITVLNTRGRMGNRIYYI